MNRKAFDPECAFIAPYTHSIQVADSLFSAARGTRNPTRDAPIPSALPKAGKDQTYRTMPETQIISEFSISAIESLENYFRNAGSSLIRAAFAHTYFVHPDKVRERTPFFHDRARFSRVHYPGLVKGSGRHLER